MMEKHGIQNHSTFTGKGPRKGWRTPLSKVKYSEQRDEEKERSRGPFASERGDEPRSGIPNGSTYLYTYFGARYMDHEQMTMWLSVDPLADKYPSISPYAYCAWNPVKLVDPDGKMWKDSTDAKVATEIRSSVMQRISDIESSINSCQQKIDKRMAKGKNVDEQLFQLSELQNQKLLLEDFVIGIDQLEQSEDVVFTFNPTRGDYHEVSLYMSDEYSINYQSGNDGNLVHETTHAIQLYRINFCSAKSMSPIEMEMNAYSTQYSFMPSSVSVLYNDSGISPSSKIPLAWVKRLYLISNGKKIYPYDKK